MSEDRTKDFEGYWIFSLVPLQILIWPLTLVAYLIYKKIPWKYSFGPLGFCVVATIVWGGNFYYPFGLFSMIAFGAWLALQILKSQE